MVKEIINGMKSKKIKLELEENGTKYKNGLKGKKIKPHPGLLSHTGAFQTEMAFCMIKHLYLSFPKETQ